MAAVVAATSSVAAGATSAPRRTARPVTAAPAPAANTYGRPVPHGFVPASVSFVSGTTGFVLGTQPCGRQRCAGLAATNDGGATWHQRTAPPVGVAQVRFASPHVGYDFGTAVSVAGDGGKTWPRPVPDSRATHARDTATPSTATTTRHC